MGGDEIKRGLRVVEGSSAARDVQQEIDTIVKTNRIVLFMKGDPAAPQCGFSARAAAILSSYQQPFYAVNVLRDQDIREGIKEYADWPTIPQLFVEGEFIGGSDIMASMHESGELQAILIGSDIW
jgi:monothiol glutaredoxin